MKRLAWFSISGVLVASGVAGALGACGSDAATVGDNGVEAGAEGSSGTSGTSGTSGGTEGGADAGKDGSNGGIEGGAASNPNMISCGTAACTSPAQVCCASLNGDAGCIAANANCQGASIGCDEKADCTGTQVCCTKGFTATECKDSCGAQSIQLCKTNAECADGTCYVNKCQGGRVVQACSKVPTCTQ